MSVIQSRGVSALQGYNCIVIIEDSIPTSVSVHYRAGDR